VISLRNLWFQINASYWFLPALFALSGFVLAQILVYVDRSGVAEFLNSIAAISPARPQGASNMLTVIAGSMLGVASTVFSITIAAVAYASGTYGPRLLTNFMEDRGNQFSLATFIGTFVYAISVLRTVRLENEAAANVDDAAATSLPGFVPQLSLLVGFGLLIVSVGVLVFFLHHIPASIRINTVLEGIGRRLLKEIDHRFPVEADAVAPAPPEGGVEIPALKVGYVQAIDFSGLAEKLAKWDAALVLAVRPGDFVQPGAPLARLCGAESGEERIAKINDCFALGATRTPAQDIEFPIDELVEIALRALSPGINDPFTAITAIHWLGAATTDLGRRPLDGHPKVDEADCPRVYPLGDGFAHFLNRGFGAARGALASNRLAAQVALDALATAARSIGDESRSAMLMGEADRLLAQAELALGGPERDAVRARHAAIVAGLR
jgi:uncharacterized membrane protein